MDIPYEYIHMYIYIYVYKYINIMGNLVGTPPWGWLAGMALKLFI